MTSVETVGSPPRRVVALVVGTRPEAIKLAPLYFELKRHGTLAPVLISTGQHADLTDTALAAFGLAPDERLSVMAQGQTPNAVAARILERLPPVLERTQPGAVLVQGDTTTVLASTLASFHLGIPVGHVEAGLRTFDLTSPFPEEGNRQLTDRLARWCFAPTEGAKRNLLAEGIPAERICVCGNTAVDAILWMSARCPEDQHKGVILMTLHRRESFGEPLAEILRGVRDFLDRNAQARVVWPVHPNPNVTRSANAVLGVHPRLLRIDPLGYREFVGLLRDCRFVLSDSGGVQEEAPSLGKTVLIAREATERPEAVELGLNRIVGRNRDSVARALQEAWNEPLYSGELPARSPYGDGRSAGRIVAHLHASMAGGNGA